MRLRCECVKQVVLYKYCVAVNHRIYFMLLAGLLSQINSVIVKRQTLTHLDKEMERWIKVIIYVASSLEYSMKVKNIMLREGNNICCIGL